MIFLMTNLNRKIPTYRGKFLVIGRTITALSRNSFAINFCGRKSIYRTGALVAPHNLEGCTGARGRPGSEQMQKGQVAAMVGARTGLCPLELLSCVNFTSVIDITTAIVPPLQHLL